MTRFSSNHPDVIVFLALFGVCFVALEIAYFMIPDQVLRDLIYLNGIVMPAVEAINIISPNLAVVAQQNTLVSPKVILEVVRGCDGAGTLFLVISAIAAYPASLKHKSAGLISGFFFVYLVNEFRIIGLFYVAAFKEHLFLLMHTYFAPTLIIVVCTLFFMMWIKLNNQIKHEPATII